jgi:hypothetical protein
MNAPGDLLHLAIATLAGVCDGAYELDGQGYNKPDSYLGRTLALIPVELWTGDQRREAYEMLAKYKGQLAAYGIDYDAIPVPPEVPRGPGSIRERRTVALEADCLAVRWDYNDNMFPRFKSAVQSAGAKWDADVKAWRIPFPLKPEAVRAIEMLADEKGHGFRLQTGVQEKLNDVDMTAPAPPTRRVTIDGEHFTVTWPYHDPHFREIKDNVKVAGARWNPKAKHWSFRQDDTRGADCILHLSSRYEFSLGEGVAVALAKLMKAAEQRAEASEATTGELDIPNLNGTLRPFQVAGVQYALDVERVLFADEMGLGKTVQALAWLEILFQRADSGRALIIVPASLKYNWLREANVWLPHRFAMVYDNGHIPANVQILIANYERVYVREKKNGKKKGKDNDVKFRPEIEAFRSKGLTAIVVDESHYCKNYKAIRTKAIKKLAKGLKYVALLTGTPILNRPQELISQLEVLGWLRVFGGLWKFAYRYCDAQRGRYGLDMSGASNLEELNDRLRSTCMVRRTKDVVLTELPDKQRTSLPIEIDNRAEYQRAEDDVVSFVAEQAGRDRQFHASISHLSADKKQQAINARMQDAAYKAERAERLVRIEALKQVAVRGKMEAAKEWIADTLESGQKLVLFAHHRDVQGEIADAFPGCARLHGDDSAEQRQANVDRFQEDDDCRLIVCSLSVGGVGVTLTAASIVAFLELGWSPGVHDQAEDRLHRIGQKDAVNAYYLLAHDTIDEIIAELIESKRAVVDASTDGDAERGAEAGNILNELLRRMAERKAA